MAGYYGDLDAGKDGSDAYGKGGGQVVVNVCVCERFNDGWCGWRGNVQEMMGLGGGWGGGGRGQIQVSQ